MTNVRSTASSDEIAYRLDFCDALPNERFETSALYRVAAGQLSADAAVEMLCFENDVRISEAAKVQITCWDDYQIPGSLTLRNRIVDTSNPLGIEDPTRFRELEWALSRIRMVELLLDPVQGRFDYDHSKAIHRRLFQDIYSWAGCERIGPETPVVRFLPDSEYTPGDPSAPMVAYRYLSGPEMRERATLFGGLMSDLMARPAVDPEDFFSLSTELSAEWMTIHPYRDGNTRAGWVYFSQFMRQMGIMLDPRQVVSGTESRRRLDQGILKITADGDHRPLTAAVSGLITDTTAID